MIIYYYNNIYIILYIFIVLYIYIYIYIYIYYNNKYSMTLCHSISAIDHASLDEAV